MVVQVSGTDQLSDEERGEENKVEERRHSRQWSRTPSPSPRKRDASPHYSNLVVTRDRNDGGGRSIREREEQPPTQSRRVFTPPRNARRLQDGALTKYENENDLPTSSKVLQERLQAKLAAIERRHGGRDEVEESGPQEMEPRRRIWVPPPSEDRGRGRRFPFRDRGGYRGGRFQFRGGRGGGRRWSPKRRSRSRSRSHSGGRRDSRRRRDSSVKTSSSSASPPPKGKKANVTRAVLNLPELASLEKSTRLTSKGDEGLADVDNFVAQLKAKRQGGGDAEIGPRALPDSPIRSPKMSDLIRLE
ncbi:Tetratricopeptide repeat protein 14 [Cichlidogyrus casuarinus]|uniref:Tetratricopeptide repeat protein 14 n=1 Tax=Cichlidogyrus casuarinus TaxID=1844966 RepID=A0ABD2QCE2_9PLAT